MANTQPCVVGPGSSAFPRSLPRRRVASPARTTTHGRAGHRATAVCGSTLSLCQAGTRGRCSDPYNTIPGARREPDPQAVEQELEALLDRLQPGWQRELVERQFLPHMNATNAIVQARLGSQPGRPGPAVPGIRHLYVVGDWVGPAGQLTAAGLASARQAAHLACEQTLPQSGAAEAANIVM